MKRWLFIFILLWTCKQFYYMEDISNFLNSLSPERAIEAKIVSVFPDEFKEGTYWDKGYYLFYRIDK